MNRLSRSVRQSNGPRPFPEGIAQIEFRGPFSLPFPTGDEHGS